MKKRIMHVAFAMLMAISLPLVALADHNDFHESDDPIPSDQGASVPIDMGIGLAIAGGIGYAVKKRRDKRVSKGEK